MLALVGYDGTVNRYGTPELLSVALRSWEERFDTVLPRSVSLIFGCWPAARREPWRTLRL